MKHCGGYMKKAYCPICGESNGTVIGVGEDYEYGTFSGPFNYSLCLKCKHMFLADIPEYDQFASLYPSSYYTNNPSSPLFLEGMIYSKKIEMDVKRISAIMRGRRINSILDIGCGDCRRLIGLKRMVNGVNRTLYGLDIYFSEAVIKNAYENGVFLIQKNIANFDAGDVKFDLVMMSQLIEHVYDPTAVMRNVRSMLNPGGLLVIETPNWNSLDFQIFKKKYWGGYHFPRHFNIFSLLSLKLLVEKGGFDVISHGFLPSPGFWIVSLRNIARLNSRQKTSSLLEFLNFRNIAVVGLFSLFDKIMIAAGGSTSNQYLVAER
jgi:2-polyprenyl-3-methyl-5-hydroxy-6-metoxy-1,4-benzoquinol methylase